MAENPRFNNSGMFTDASEDYSEITPDNKSEVLATQGNVINSIKVFWNNLKAKLAYAVTRPDYSKAVGGNYVPIFVNADGVVQECQPTTVNAGIANSGIITIPTDTIPNDNIYTGTTVCINVSSNSASNSDNSLQIQHNNVAATVKYPSGITVLAKDISGGDLLLTTFCKTGSTNFWILLNKINTVVSTGQTTDGNVSGGNPGLMTAKDKAKLDTIAWGANAYSLPAATSNSLGGVQLGYAGNGKNYQVQKDDNNNLFVNVPWTDNDTHNTARIAMTMDKNSPNITLTNSDGSDSSSIPVVGLGGTQVTIGDEGQLVIDTLAGSTYDALSKNNGYDTVGYTVKGPGRENINNGYVLRGDGTWSSVIAQPSVAGQNLSWSNNTLTGNVGIGYDVEGISNTSQACIWICNNQIVSVGNKLGMSTLNLPVGTKSLVAYFIPIKQAHPEYGILLPGKLTISTNTNTGSVSASITY